MTYGIRTFDSSGNVVFDSTTIDVVHGAAVVDVFTIGSVTSGSKSYPELAGYSCDVLGINIYNPSDLSVYSSPNISIDHASGHPIVSWSPGSQWYAGGGIVVVLTRTVVADAQYGLKVSSLAGDLILSDFTLAFKKISPALIDSGYWPGGISGQLAAWPQAVYRFESAGPVLPMIKPSGYFALLGVTNPAPGIWDAYTVGYVSDVIGFSSQSAVECGPYGMAVFRPDGAVAWDSSYAPMVLRDAASIAVGGTASVNGGADPYWLVGSPGYRIYGPGSGYSWELISFWQIGGTEPTYTLSRPEQYLAVAAYDRGSGTLGYGAKSAYVLDNSFY